MLPAGGFDEIQRIVAERTGTPEDRVASQVGGFPKLSSHDNQVLHLSSMLPEDDNPAVCCGGFEDSFATTRNPRMLAPAGRWEKGMRMHRGFVSPSPTCPEMSSDYIERDRATGAGSGRHLVAGNDVVPSGAPRMYPPRSGVAHIDLHEARYSSGVAVLLDRGTRMG